MSTEDNTGLSPPDPGVIAAMVERLKYVDVQGGECIEVCIEGSGVLVKNIMPMTLVRSIQLNQYDGPTPKPLAEMHIFMICCSTLYGFSAKKYYIPLQFYLTVVTGELLYPGVTIFLLSFQHIKFY